jgi:dienelactone hydrolase
MKLVIALLALVLCGTAQAKIVTKAVEYKDKDAVLEGYLAYDDARKGKLPGVLIVHEWTGIGDYVKERARMLAKLGYVAFAEDIYGKGIRPETPKEAGAEAGKYKNDRPLLRERALAGLEQLKKQPKVDTSRLAAIGYCFGGTAALELARAGADLKGVAVFHAGLSTPMPAEPGKVKAKIAAYQGADDPNVPRAEVEGFEDEMRKAKADWTLTQYANTVHAFTNHYMTGAHAFPGSAEYNPVSDRRSWAALQDNFREWFQSSSATVLH